MINRITFICFLSFIILGCFEESGSRTQLKFKKSKLNEVAKISNDDCTNDDLEILKLIVSLSADFTCDQIKDTAIYIPTNNEAKTTVKAFKHERQISFLTESEIGGLILTAKHLQIKISD